MAVRDLGASSRPGVRPGVVRTKDARTVLLGAGAITFAAIASYALARRGLKDEAALAALLLLGLACWTLPVAGLAGLATLMAVAFPANELPVGRFLGDFPVAIIPFGAWLIRRSGAPSDSVTKVLGIFLAVWVCFTEFVAQVHITRGPIWAAVAVVGICVASQNRRAVDLEAAEKWLVRLGTALAIYAIVEAVLHQNPLLGAAYAHATPPLLEHWSTYRVTTLMGHPLVNATGFSIFGVLALDMLLKTSKGASWRLLQLLVIALALVLTEARGGFIAFGVSAVLLVVAYAVSGRLALRHMALGVVLLAVFASGAGVLAARSTSQEGQQSLQDRFSLVSQTDQAIGRRWIEGVGAGEAEAARQQELGAATTVALESSYAELLVGIGVVGLFAFCALFLWRVARGLREPRTAGWSCALLALLIAIGGYNGVEGHPQLLVWLGGLFVLTNAAKPSAIALPSSA